MRLEKLESLRGFAAIYVMLSHLSSNYLHLQKSWLGQPFRYGQEGVLLFFLLSGFVIYYSWQESSGPRNFKIFFYKRFRRIYPIFLLSLALAYTVMCLKHGLQPLNVFSLAGNVFMLQGLDVDPGWKAPIFMDNGPLWSLSYEWWFYMMFYPVYRFVPSNWQKALVLALACLGLAGEEMSPNIFFNILASFPLWWCGVEFAREYLESGTFTLRRQAGTICILVPIAMAYGFMVWNRFRQGLFLGILNFPLANLRHYSLTLLLVAAFFAWRRIGFRGFAFTLGPFKVFAGMSYALYVFHYPIICHLEFTSAPSLLFLNVCCKVTLVLVLAYLSEEVWQKHVQKWMDRIWA